MRQEQARKKAQTQREAAEKEAEAKKHARKDDPWLQKGIVVKVRHKTFRHLWTVPSEHCAIDQSKQGFKCNASNQYCLIEQNRAN